MFCLQALHRDPASLRPGPHKIHDEWQVPLFRLPRVCGLGVQNYSACTECPWSRRPPVSLRPVLFLKGALYMGRPIHSWSRAWPTTHALLECFCQLLQVLLWVFLHWLGFIYSPGVNHAYRPISYLPFFPKLSMQNELEVLSQWGSLHSSKWAQTLSP